jgi:dTDP-4-amino-4,6-dideoxygalactose transaminase
MITPKLVGGAFGFNVSLKCTKPPFLSSISSFYLNARSAIFAVISSLDPKAVWMPSYLCLSMLESAKLANIQVRYFPVNKYLNVEEMGWIADITEGDVVIVIDYFGFKMPEWLYGEIRRRGAFIIEDASQALLSLHVGKYSDFVVYSPRKFVGVPDGGILLSKIPLAISTDRIKPPSNWWMKAFATCLLRSEFDSFESNSDRVWFRLSKEIESDMPVGNFEASALSVAILESATDWEYISNKRRENYLTLLDDLKKYALYKYLPDDVVPLGFPISVKNRDELRQALFDKNIYPPIHWELADAVPKQYVESLELSQHILTLICDQRYEKNDMERIVHVVKETGIE